MQRGPIKNSEIRSISEIQKIEGKSDYIAEPESSGFLISLMLN